MRDVVSTITHTARTAARDLERGSSSGQLARIYGFTDVDGSNPTRGAISSRYRTRGSPPT